MSAPDGEESQNHHCHFCDSDFSIVCLFLREASLRQLVSFCKLNEVVVHVLQIAFVTIFISYLFSDPLWAAFWFELQCNVANYSNCTLEPTCSVRLHRNLQGKEKLLRRSREREENKQTSKMQLTPQHQFYERKYPGNNRRW